MEKKYRRALRVRPSPSDMTFNECAEGLVAYFDSDLLAKYLPPTLGAIDGDLELSRLLGGTIPDETGEALRETEFIGVYGRVLRTEDDSRALCLQYLFVWDYQAVPAHECDYEPVFVYIFDDSAYMIYDFVHYCSRRMELPLQSSQSYGLQVVPGWHSFLPRELSEDSRDQIEHIVPLSDQHLHSWWSIPEEGPRLKIVDTMRDPYLLEAPGHFLTDPDENARTICCSFLEIERALRDSEDPGQGIIEGAKRALIRCVGILALYRLGAFLQLLGEMRDIGMVRTSAPLTGGGFNLNAILALLGDGLVNLTRAGDDILRGIIETGNHEGS
ncbi:MAG: hypothetical protein ACP6KW_09915 [Candidatus Thorarchaeota archaeon]